jgi:hypothetical protein
VLCSKHSQPLLARKTRGPWQLRGSGEHKNEERKGLGRVKSCDEPHRAVSHVPTQPGTTRSTFVFPIRLLRDDKIAMRYETPPAAGGTVTFPSRSSPPPLSPGATAPALRLKPASRLPSTCRTTSPTSQGTPTRPTVPLPV